MRTQPLDLGKYERRLRRIKIVWMNGRELGMVMGKNEVALWPYMPPISSFEALTRVFTHEVVHQVHPELDMNEGAVEALTTALMERPAWVRHAQAALGQALFEGVRAMRVHRVWELG